MEVDVQRPFQCAGVEQNRFLRQEDQTRAFIGLERDVYAGRRCIRPGAVDALGGLRRQDEFGAAGGCRFDAQLVAVGDAACGVQDHGLECCAMGAGEAGPQAAGLAERSQRSAAWSRLRADHGHARRHVASPQPGVSCDSRFGPCGNAACAARALPAKNA